MKMRTNKELIREAILSGNFLSVEEQLKQYGIPLYQEQSTQLREWADIIDDIANKWDTIK